MRMDRAARSSPTMGKRGRSLQRQSGHNLRITARRNSPHLTCGILSQLWPMLVLQRLSHLGRAVRT